MTRINKIYTMEGRTPLSLQIRYSTETQPGDSVQDSLFCEALFRVKHKAQNIGKSSNDNSKILRQKAYEYAKTITQITA